MPTYLTATQAAQRLGKSEKTIRRWIDEKRLPAFHPQGRKNRLAIAEQDIDKLAQELAEYEQPAAPISSEQDTTALVERMTELERRVTELEQRLARATMPTAPTAVAEQDSATRTRAPRVITPTAAPTDIPPGSVHMRDFAEHHGVNAATFRDHITSGNVPALTIPKLNRPREVERWLTPDQQQQAIDYWRSHGKPFTPNQEQYPALNYGVDQAQEQ